MPPDNLDVAEIASQRRESELEHSQNDWTPAPQAGEFVLNADLATKTGLEYVNADEFIELLLAAKGLG
jgi:hypothetical protein